MLPARSQWITQGGSEKDNHDFLLPRNPMRRALCAVLFILVGFNHPLAEVRIEASPGGVVGNYLELFAVLKQSGRGHDMRALQAYLGHRNIQHTVRYTELSPTRFKNL